MRNLLSLRAVRSLRASISPYVVAGIVAVGAIPGVALSSCTSQFVTPHSSSFLTMTLSTKNAKKVTGSDSNRLALSFSNVSPFIFDFEALTPDGQVDTSFNGFVRISAHPGAISSITGNGAEGRNVQLTNGVATSITVNVLGAYGDTHLWAEDIGYAPADPAGTPPACADGLDNNNNGLIDFPADPGCAFANDNTEDGGSFTTGISETLFFNLPRVADVRGVSQGGTATSFPSEQVQVDPGPAMPSVPCTDQANPKADHKSPCVVVTRIAADGFYVTDITETRGFSSVYAYNFSAPPNMAICDRITSFGGTSSDFFGFTEVNYPTWTLDVYEGYDPKHNIGRPCGIPEPHVFTANELPVKPATSTTLLNYAAALVRVQSGVDTEKGSPDLGVTTSIHIGSHFGEGFPKGPGYMPTDSASNCDINGDGKLDFTAGVPEDTCANNCDADPECTEYSGFLSQSAFRIVVEQTNADGSMTPGAILGNASAASNFIPLDYRGKQIRSFSGTLRYFSGGSSFTIEARCPDDIVTDLKKAPIASDVACIGQINGTNAESQ